MHKVFLGIGGNIGDKRHNFEKVCLRIIEDIGEICDRSSVYETTPWGFQSNENFWNQVLLVNTMLEPEELLSAAGKIEDLYERKREPGRYLSREMDIDILYFDDAVINTERIQIPHPLMHRRLFVLVPLTEIAPSFKHPLLAKTSRQLLSDCTDDATTIKKILF